MSDNTTTLKVLSTITSAARNEYKSRGIVVTLCTEARIANIDPFDIRNAYIRGRMMVALGASEAEAGKVMALKVNEKDKPQDDQHRTIAQEKAYGAARVAWSTVMRDAGFPVKKAKARKARPANTSNTPVTVSAMVIPKTVNAVQVGQWMHLISASLTKFEAKNSGAFIGDDGAKYRDAIHAFVASVKSVHVEEQPVTKVHMARTSRGH